MLRVDLKSSLCWIRRQWTAVIDVRQRLATQMCYHVVDCTHFLLHGRGGARTLGHLDSVLVHFLHNSTTTSHHQPTSRRIRVIQLNALSSRLSFVYQMDCLHLFIRASTRTEQTNRVRVAITLRHGITKSKATKL